MESAPFMIYPVAWKYLNDLGIPIAEQTLRRMVSEKRIPFTKLSKRVVFQKEALDRWLAARAVAPQGSK